MSLESDGRTEVKFRKLKMSSSVPLPVCLPPDAGAGRGRRSGAGTLPPRFALHTEPNRKAALELRHSQLAPFSSLTSFLPSFLFSFFLSSLPSCERKMEGKKEGEEENSEQNMNMNERKGQALTFGWQVSRRKVTILTFLTLKQLTSH